MVENLPFSWIVCDLLYSCSMWASYDNHLHWKICSERKTNKWNDPCRSGKEKNQNFWADICISLKDIFLNQIILFLLWNILCLIFQSSKFIFNLPTTIFGLISIVCGTPIKDLYGDYMCWILSGLLASNCLKQTLGGFSIAMYRIVCLERPEIAMSQMNQRKLRNHLLFLELATMTLLLGFCCGGAIIAGTEPTMEFLR